MFLRRLLCIWITVSFLATIVIPPQRVYAQTILNLPEPGTMVSLSAAYIPVLIKGLKINPNNPLSLDFIVATGNSQLTAQDPNLRKESEKLIKYFFAALTLPEKDVWVNLSPYEKDRIVPQVTGETEMGRDMLAEDYILKQITASLIYPEKGLGKDFWNKIYTEAYQRFGTTQIPVNTFNKVWIVADKASVYEARDTVLVVDSHLKVMLEEDYLATQKHQSPTRRNNLGSEVVRQIVLPALEKEVNEGKNFANLRQIFHSLILAKWYKETLKTALLNQVYSNKNKTAGLSFPNTSVGNPQYIYQQYIKAYKKGVFNYIKEDIDQATKEPLARKYFSGGITSAAMIVRKATVNEAMMSFKSLAAGALIMVGVTATAQTALAQNLPTITEPAFVLNQTKADSQQHLKQLKEEKTGPWILLEIFVVGAIFSELLHRNYYQSKRNKWIEQMESSLDEKERIKATKPLGTRFFENDPVVIAGLENRIGILERMGEDYSDEMFALVGALYKIAPNRVPQMIFNAAMTVEGDNVHFDNGWVSSKEQVIKILKDIETILDRSPRSTNLKFIYDRHEINLMQGISLEFNERGIKSKVIKKEHTFAIPAKQKTEAFKILEQIGKFITADFAMTEGKEKIEPNVKESILPSSTYLIRGIEADLLDYKITFKIDKKGQPLKDWRTIQLKYFETRIGQNENYRVLGNKALAEMVSYVNKHYPGIKFYQDKEISGYRLLPTLVWKSDAEHHADPIVISQALQWVEEKLHEIEVANKPKVNPAMTGMEINLSASQAQDVRLLAAVLQNKWLNFNSLKHFLSYETLRKLESKAIVATKESINFGDNIGLVLDDRFSNQHLVEELRPGTEFKSVVVDENEFMDLLREIIHNSYKGTEAVEELKMFWVGQVSANAVGHEEVFKRLGGVIFRARLAWFVYKVTANDEETTRTVGALSDLTTTLFKFEGRYYSGKDSLERKHGFDTYTLRSIRNNLTDLLKSGKTYNDVLKNIQYANQIAQDLSSKLSKEKLFQNPLLEFKNPSYDMTDARIAVDLMPLVKRALRIDSLGQQFEIIIPNVWNKTYEPPFFGKGSETIYKPNIQIRIPPKMKTVSGPKPVYMTIQEMNIVDLQDPKAIMGKRFAIKIKSGAVINLTISDVSSDYISGTDDKSKSYKITREAFVEAKLNTFRTYRSPEAMREAELKEPGSVIGKTFKFTTTSGPEFELKIRGFDIGSISGWGDRGERKRVVDLFFGQAEEVPDAAMTALVDEKTWQEAERATGKNRAKLLLEFEYGKQGNGDLNTFVRTAIADANTIKIRGERTDKATLATPNGGIDLNASKLDLQKTGSGIEIKFDPATIEQFKLGNFNGIVPVITGITPIANIYPLLGLKEPAENEKVAA
jgi:hypothetical protein